MTRKHFNEERAKLTKERSKLETELEEAEGNLSLPNRIRDAKIDNLRTQLEWNQKDLDELYDEPITD